jgi:transmembrane sensor
MTGPTPTNDDLNRMAAAADWLVRLHDAPGNEALAVAWLQWCEEEPSNLHEFRAAQSVWHAAHPSPPQAQAAPEPTVPEAANSSHWSKRRTWLGLAATVLIALGLGSTVYLRSGGDELMQSYATPIAGTGSSVLPDGSRVELGADSRITTRYTAKQRSISVDFGEAYFLVAKDPGRPFLVNAGDMKVTAVGTAFNVRRNNDRVVIAVSEGRVQLGNNSESADTAATANGTTPLEAGQQAIYSSDSRTVTIAQIKATDVASWRSGVLKYRHEPLGSVAQDLSRYHSKRIVISDARLSAMPFTGTVFSSRIGDALSALESVFPLQVKEHPDAIELIPRG